MDIKSILADGQKSHIIREIAEQSRTSTEERDDPTVFVWSSYFLAQLLSQLGDHDEALQVLNDLEQHTPTLPEICTLRAKILKRLGDIAGASDAMEEARQLDGQDRFLNWKVAKYLLRQDKCAEAQDILGLFTKVFLNIERRTNLTLCPRKMLSLLVRILKICSACYILSKKGMPFVDSVRTVWL
jgi:tetratricopeptide (TPR) repeat protein